MPKMRIAAVSFLVDDAPHTQTGNIERAAAYVHQAAAQGAHIVCLPEYCSTVNVEAGERWNAERYPGATTALFAAAARAHRIAIVAPYLVSAGRRFYSQATVFDRTGRVAGIYRKVQPTGEELRRITPGSSLPVIDIGEVRIAVMLCLDLAFPEIARIYAMKGADMLFCPTVAHGPTPELLQMQLRARAADNSIPVICSNLSGLQPYAPYSGRVHPGNACIIDHHGDVLAQTGKRHGIAVADIDRSEARLGSGIFLFHEPDDMRADMQRLVRMNLYAREYAAIARAQARAQGKDSRAEKKGRR